MSQRVIKEFAPEALAKAKELQIPGSLATGAALGITLYIHGHREPRVVNMIRKGIKFLELYERDLSASLTDLSDKIPKSPRFYKPSEILKAPSLSKLEDADKIEKLEELKKVMLAIVNQESDLPSEEDLKECHMFLSSLATPYVASAMNSMSEYKRSRKGTTW